MATAFVDVKFGGYMILAEEEEVVRGADGEFVGDGGGDEGGRGDVAREFVGLHSGNELVGDDGFREIGRGDHGDEVGTETGIIGGVDGLIETVLRTVINGEHGHQVSAGGESDGADVLGVEAQLRGAIAEKTDGALDILQRLMVHLIVAATFRDAILQEHAGDAEGTEPVDDVYASRINAHGAVAAAGTDDDHGRG